MNELEKLKWNIQNRKVIENEGNPILSTKVKSENRI